MIEKSKKIIIRENGFLCASINDDYIGAIECVYDKEFETHEKDNIRSICSDYIRGYAEYEGSVRPAEIKQEIKRIHKRVANLIEAIAPEFVSRAAFTRVSEMERNKYKKRKNAMAVVDRGWESYFLIKSQYFITCQEELGERPTDGLYWRAKGFQEYLEYLIKSKELISNFGKELNPATDEMLLKCREVSKGENGRVDINKSLDVMSAVGFFAYSHLTPQKIYADKYMKYLAFYFHTQMRRKMSENGLSWRSFGYMERVSRDVYPEIDIEFELKERDNYDSYLNIVIPEIRDKIVNRCKSIHRKGVDIKRN